MKKKYSTVIMSIILLVFLNNNDNNCGLDQKIVSKNIVIFLHLYNLSLMNEFIHRINKFMELNKSDNFYIKITIPVAENVNSFKIPHHKRVVIDNKDDIYKHCLQLAPYHPEIITAGNSKKLFSIACYLKENLKARPENVQIIFSENRGMDIGGFLLALDQLIKENLSHDYLIKIHSKMDSRWRNRLLAILDLNLNKYIPEFDSIYGCKHESHDQDAIERITRKILKKILIKFNLPMKKKFPFCAGTMFLVSHEMTNFFKQYDLLALYAELSLGYTRAIIYEHAYERLFGYLMCHLDLKTYYCSLY